jgi:hypothetical protein
MNLEHIGLCVEHPISIAGWWVANLGFEFIRKMGTDAGGVAFIADYPGPMGNLHPTE